jgi:hypothetical protein
MLQPTLQATLWLMLQQTLRPMPLVTSSTTQQMLPMFRKTSLQTQDTTQELSLLWSRPIVQKEASVTA